MENNKSVRQLTSLLAFVAGSADATTFITVRQLFSAHVTGNIVVYAFDLFGNSDQHSWMKLLSIPIFIFAIVLAGRYAGKFEQRFSLLIAEGSLLITSGFIAIVMTVYGTMDNSTLSFANAMLIVFAMGLQNAFNKLFSQSTYGPTTIMTGNVSKLSINLGYLWKSGLDQPLIVKKIQQQSLTIGGFIIGCFFGAMSAQMLGSSAILIPGVLVLLYALNLTV